jgi:hypothetical protein
MKMWLEQEMQYRVGCAREDIKYIVLPPEAQDRNGFLREEYWSADGFHGNDAYGEMMLDYVSRVIREDLQS